MGVALLRPHGATTSTTSGSGPFYLALGDSVPVWNGNNSYPYLIASNYSSTNPGLQVVDMACSSETTGTMLANSLCAPAPQRSQQQEAVAFLQAHQGQVALITLDIGGNDVLPCVNGLTVNLACIQQAESTMVQNLDTILSGIRQAAGPTVPIVGMNYFDPFLGDWLAGGSTQVLANLSVSLVTNLNTLLGGRLPTDRSPRSGCGIGLRDDRSDRHGLLSVGQRPRRRRQSLLPPRHLLRGWSDGGIRRRPERRRGQSDCSGLRAGHWNNHQPHHDNHHYNDDDDVHVHHALRLWRDHVYHQSHYASTDDDRWFNDHDLGYGCNHVDISAFHDVIDSGCRHWERWYRFDGKARVTAASGSLAFTGSGQGLNLLTLLGSVLVLVGVVLLVLVDVPRRVLRQLLFVSAIPIKVEDHDDVDSESVPTIPGTDS